MERINIAELLKDCPEGTELDCTMYENVEFDCIVDNENLPIRCRIKNPNGGYNTLNLTKYGQYFNNHCAKCVIFPKGKTTWEGFIPPCKFKDGDIMYVKTINRHEYIIIFKEIKNDYIHKYVCFTYQRLSIDKCPVCQLADAVIMRPATEEEKQKLFKAIKENGYKWNPETKTSEKLIEPKFKVGDRVRLKLKHDYVYTIYSLTWDDNKQLTYRFLPNNDKHLILVSLNKQDNYELVPDKFNISDLKPFDKVLVRQNISWKWGIDFFDFYDGRFYHATGGCMYAQCIPYEGNEHLRGKTDDCDEYYKTWK